MRRRSGIIVVMLVFLVSLTACGGNQAGNASEGSPSGSASAAKSNSISIALSTWVGFAPLYIAQEKGFFEKNGIKVELLKMESVADRRTMLAANKIQGFTSTVDTHVVTAASNIPVTQVVALDDSYGGDGLVAKKEIKSLKDLVGKNVAVQTDGGASFFWFLYLLDKEGIDVNSVHLQSMSAGDAGAAFVAKKVDAAVTWEPWLSKAKKTDFGTVLLSSDKTPGVITDTLALSKNFADQNPDAVKALVKSWFEAVDYYKSNPDDAISIMAKAMGETAEDFKGEVSGVRYYDQQTNKEYFGTKEQPGKLRELTELGVKFWKEQKLIDTEPNIDDLIDYTFIQ
ncbi:MAG: ABC transporter substrate-binding protein [Paenibacillus sp.]|uniref:ABC transporter substrate-binding protein n=1 Tax=Paenibacillus sp. TaxID=58172 RepID=UPI002901339E|nr:ABC transporter substrate-binding protein [Paenibacillus sp.]MDU2241949.1 ABC transporter substrate-binding protein [Paenibacillus sp.]